MEEKGIKPDAITVKELEAMCDKFYELTEDYKRKKDEATKIYADSQRILRKLENYFEAWNWQDYKHPRAGTFYLHHDISFTLSKNENERNQFYNDFKTEKGEEEFYNHITMSKPTLRKICGPQFKEAREKGIRVFKIIGVEKKERKYIKLRSK